MFKYKEAKKNVLSFRAYSDFLLYNKNGDDINNVLCISDCTLSELHCTAEEKIIGYYVLGDKLIYVSKASKTTTCINLKDFKRIYQFSDMLINLTSQSINVNDKIYYGNTLNSGFVKCDLATGQIIEQLNPERSNKFQLPLNDSLIQYDKDQGQIARINFTLDNLWNNSVKDLAAYSDYDGQHPGEIKQVYAYGEQIIASVTRGIISFDHHTGKVLWHIQFEDFNPNHLHIIDSKAYLAQGIFYAVIDLDKGKKLLETTLGKNIQVGGVTIPLVSCKPDIVHYNNRVRRLDRHDSKYYLFARVPDTGEITYSGQLSELTVPCYAPQFNEERMFILDQEGVLHVYEDINKL